MKTRLVLKPGDKGTKKVVREFGERLICVRYRYDEEGRRRLKTAEVILEDVPWEPTRPPEDVRPVIFTPLGYPADAPSTKERRALSDLVKYDEY